MNLEYTPSLIIHNFLHAMTLSSIGIQMTEAAIAGFIGSAHSGPFPSN